MKSFPAPPASSPFEALLDAARSDAAAAEGLAQAYGDLDPDARRRLCEIVARDADEHALAMFLAVESSPELASEIAGRIAGLAREARAFRWGDAARGGLLVLRPLFGPNVQALGLAWDGEALRVEAEPLTDASSLASLRVRLGAPDPGERVGAEEALDELAGRLWRFARAGGSLPEEVRALEHFFVLRPRVAP